MTTTTPMTNTSSQRLAEAIKDACLLHFDAPEVDWNDIASEVQSALTSQPSGDVAGLVERLLDTKRAWSHQLTNIDRKEAADTITALSAERDAKDARIAELEGALKAKPWPPSDSELADLLASVVEAWWSPSTANLIRAGKRTTNDIKGMYALRDALAPYIARAALKEKDNG